MDQFYSEEQRMVRDTARKLSENVVAPAAATIDREDEFPREIYNALAEQGLFGVALSEDAGGVGLDAMAACIVMEEIARGSGAVGNAFAIPVEAALFLLFSFLAHQLLRQFTVIAGVGGALGVSWRRKQTLLKSLGAFCKGQLRVIGV